MRRAIISKITVRARMNVMRNASRARRASSSAVGAISCSDVIDRHLGPPGPRQQTEPVRRDVPMSALRRGSVFALEAYENLGHSHTVESRRTAPPAAPSSVCHGAHRLSRESMVVGGKPYD